MKFGVNFATIGPSIEPDGLKTLAMAAEQIGYESLWSVEHVAMPLDYSSQYPYNPSGKIDQPQDVSIPDPLLPLAFAAAVTDRILLGTATVILPHYHPLHLAKAVATLDRLSKGRVILGIGVGWMQEEFDALGITFEDRGARAAELVRAMRSLWSPGPSQFSGRFFNWGALESNPKPVQPDGVPIHVGGHTDLAARRAARYGNGFLPYPGSPERFSQLLTVMREECDKVGRDFDAIECSVFTPTNFTIDEVRRYEELGASRILVLPEGKTADEIVTNLQRYAETVMAHFEAPDHAGAS